MTDAERIAVLETQQATTTATLARMENKIDELNDAANKGKGAVAVLLAAGSLFGGVVGAIGAWILSHINFH